MSEVEDFPESSAEESKGEEEPVTGVPTASAKQTVVYTWGTGGSGQLGHELLDARKQCLLPERVRITVKCKVATVDCGEGYSALLTETGIVYSWGMAYKCGHGTEKGTVDSPKMVEALLDFAVTQISCGECHMGCVAMARTKAVTGAAEDSLEEKREDKRFGDVCFLWGKSQNGCVGDGDGSTHFVLTPKRLHFSGLLKKINGFRCLDLGWKVSALVLATGHLFTFGCANTGVLGYKCAARQQLTPKRVRLPKGTSVVSISFGSHHCAAVCSDGRLLTWGKGQWGNLGHGPKVRRSTLPKCVKWFFAKGVHITDVSCTKGMLTPVSGSGKEAPHTLCADANGNCFAFGSGHKGKLGNLSRKWGFHLKGVEDLWLPFCINAPSLERSSADATRFLSADTKKPTKYLLGERVSQCVASGLHSAVVSDSGKCLTFGCGSDGRMGLKAFKEGCVGAGKQMYKFYVSKPTAVEQFEEGGSHRCHVLQCASARRHMIALALK